MRFVGKLPGHDRWVIFVSHSGQSVDTIDDSMDVVAEPFLSDGADGSIIAVYDI